jgi:hypothetical protein
MLANVYAEEPVDSVSIPLTTANRTTRTVLRPVLSLWATSLWIPRARKPAEVHKSLRLRSTRSTTYEWTI